MPSVSILKAITAVLALTLVVLFASSFFSDEDAEGFADSTKQSSVARDQDEIFQVDSQCAIAQERYDKVSDMYESRGSSNIMEEALLEAEEGVDKFCNNN